MQQYKEITTALTAGDRRALARAISIVENEVPGFDQILLSLPAGNAPILGITGPPGAGKSTLVDALIETYIEQEKKIAVLCVDPSSPFNLGALLGDRIRMSQWYNHPHVFIRSLATRGALGGLHPSIIEITALLQAAGFDHIIVETVGVGQSEVEIAGLADTTIVVVVPEAGDEVQTMKAGLMEIADIFVVNKADRPDADSFLRNLKLMMAPAFAQEKNIAILKTVAAHKEGIEAVVTAINNHLQTTQHQEKKYWLYTEKVFQLIQKNKMRDISKASLKKDIQLAMQENNFQLYRFTQQYLQQ
ncbi:MAG: methylmalonyl Co-A mutase-associated GTPase MeaB [Sediminibacterium sp.]|jgi:LAO/AO transport system kinase|nr:methylmalonyl Co-A mutase-associated GTPase MeaB [Chitinophagaceae bacterium]MCA6447498.1 methylmalonyl Co-A mutase-associated GTPase MeaB [Chitinophagaceae bacterium]